MQKYNGTFFGHVVDKICIYIKLISSVHIQVTVSKITETNLRLRISYWIALHIFSLSVSKFPFVLSS